MTYQKILVQLLQSKTKTLSRFDIVEPMIRLGLVPRTNPDLRRWIGIDRVAND